MNDQTKNEAGAVVVFELIEINQCDDNYQPLGIFLSLAEAVAVVEENGVELCLNDPDEWAGVEIKERKIGLSDNGKTVWQRAWERNYEDETDSVKERWTIIKPSPNRTEESPTTNERW